jgi:hypothetical protein
VAVRAGVAISTPRRRDAENKEKFATSFLTGSVQTSKWLERRFAGVVVSTITPVSAPRRLGVDLLAYARIPPCPTSVQKGENGGGCIS